MTGFREKGDPDEAVLVTNSEPTGDDIDNAPIEEPDESGDHDEGDLSGDEDSG